MRRLLSTFVRLAVTLAGLAYVLSHIAWQDVARSLAQANAGWLALAVGLVTASLALRTVRWQALLHGLGVQTSYGRLLRLYFIGNFFNSFLPSGFGGDVVRAVEAWRAMPPDIAAGTVIMDRLSGLMMLFVMALAALPFRPAGLPERVALTLLILGGSGLLGGILLWRGHWLQRAVEIIAGWPIPGLGALLRRTLQPLLRAIQSCGGQAVARALGVSLLFNLMLVGWWWCAARALGLSVSATYLLLATPLLSLALLAPSISGLGVRESVAPLLLMGAGISAEAAVALSLTEFVLLRLVSLLGAPVYLLGRQPAAETDLPPASG